MAKFVDANGDEWTDYGLSELDLRANGFHFLERFTNEGWQYQIKGFALGHDGLSELTEAFTAIWWDLQDGAQYTFRVRDNLKDAIQDIKNLDNERRTNEDFVI